MLPLRTVINPPDAASGGTLIVSSSYETSQPGAGQLAGDQPNESGGWHPLQDVPGKLGSVKESYTTSALPTVPASISKIAMILSSDLFCLFRMAKTSYRIEEGASGGR